jgi:hypothetical protein
LQPDFGHKVDILGVFCGFPLIRSCQLASKVFELLLESEGVKAGVSKLITLPG